MGAFVGAIVVIAVGTAVAIFVGEAVVGGIVGLPSFTDGRAVTGRSDGVEVFVSNVIVGRTTSPVDRESGEEELPSKRPVRTTAADTMQPIKMTAPKTPAKISNTLEDLVLLLPVGRGIGGAASTAMVKGAVLLFGVAELALPQRNRYTRGTVGSIRFLVGR